MNPHKKVFLGDTGSLLLGSVMAFYVFYILDDRSSIVTDSNISRPLLAILLLIYPLADTLRAFIIRAYKKQSPFVADRVHLHHRLIDKRGLKTPERRNPKTSTDMETNKIVNVDCQ